MFAITAGARTKIFLRRDSVVRFNTASLGKRNRKRFFGATILFVCLLAAVTTFSELQPISNKSNLSKETQLKLLKLDEAQVSLQTAQDLYEEKKRNLEDMRELNTQDVVTGKEVNDADIDLKDAERNLELAKIDLAKTALSFLQDATHISIDDAFQYIDPENNRHMAVTLENDSDLDLALLGLGQGVPEAGIQKENIRSLLTIENLYVSVKSGSTNIGDPYEIHMAKLELNRKATLDFKLNNPADEVALSLKYHGTEESRSIYLQKKSTEDIVRVSAQQFAQEGSLGNNVEYGIDLERLAENEKTFSLGVVGLPEKYLYKFADKGNQLSRVKFSQGTTKYSLSLIVTVPDTLSENELKKPIRFFAMVGDDAAIAQAQQFAVGGRLPTDEQLTALKIGFEHLELTPRGTGKFDISFTTLYYEIKTGDKINTKMTVKNTGTVRLDNVRFNIEKPYDWEVKLTPEEIENFEPRKEINIQAEISPPSNVEVGAYEVKFEGTTEYQGATIKTDQKTVRVQVSAKANLMLNLLIIAGLIVFILIIAIVTIKLSRR
jgi:hypothetical protein